jgi:hypothetical protein
MVAMVCNRAICGVTPEFDEMAEKMSLEFNGKLLGFSFGNSEFKKKIIIWNQVKDSYFYYY